MDLRWIVAFEMSQTDVRLKSGTYNKWSNVSLRMNKLFVLNQERPVRLM